MIKLQLRQTSSLVIYLHSALCIYSLFNSAISNPDFALMEVTQIRRICYDSFLPNQGITFQMSRGTRRLKSW